MTSASALRILIVNDHEIVRRGTQEGLGRLTRLEEEILEHVSSGKTNSEVAAAVFLSEEVVRSSVSTHLEATRRSQAAAYMVAWRTWRTPSSEERSLR
jgi:DNA-binding CsgD family transcriptional regulator